MTTTKSTVWTDEIGIVVIGRNEGKRLAACLDSLPDECPAIYVDSCSTDNSVTEAKQRNLTVVELDMSEPLSAARARNAGFAAITHAFPRVRFVQFVDGDTTLDPQWLEAAYRELEADGGLAAVFGILGEADAADSVYNKLCELEWKKPPGALSYFAGIVVIRVEAMRQVGTYDTTLIAGEEPELASRICDEGYRICHLDRPMATHDAAMYRFSQWWKRTVRSGYAIGLRYQVRGDNIKEIVSTVLWGGLVPIATAGATAVFGFWALSFLFSYTWLAWRVYGYRRRVLHDTKKEACLYTVFCVIGKLPQLLGLTRAARSLVFD